MILPLTNIYHVLSEFSTKSLYAFLISPYACYGILINAQQMTNESHMLEIEREKKNVNGYFQFHPTTTANTEGRRTRDTEYLAPVILM
jgi:hypothetical protein